MQLKGILVNWKLLLNNSPRTQHREMKKRKTGEGKKKKNRDRRLSKYPVEFPKCQGKIPKKKMESMAEMQHSEIKRGYFPESKKGEF